MGNSTINAKTGGWVFKHKPWEADDSLEQSLLRRAERLYREKMGGTEAQARNAVRENEYPVAKTYVPHAEEKLYVDAEAAGKHGAAVVEANQRAWEEGRDNGDNQSGYHVWEPETQLMSRPVMFPWEIVNADAAKCIIIMPGLHNLQLTRFLYFSNPYLSSWARHDPNRPRVDKLT